MLSIFQGAWATTPDVEHVSAPTCGSDLRVVATAGPAVRTLPDLTLVDGDDPVAILNFIDAVTPFPSGRHPHALAETFAAFWSAYRPDLGEDEVRAQVAAFDFSIYALRKLRATQASKLDEWRLVRAWRRFVENYVGHHAGVRSAATRALAVPLDPVAILAYLETEFPGVTGRGGGRARIYFRKLYARDLPALTPTFGLTVRDHQLAGPGARTKRHRILLAWQSYVGDLTGVVVTVPNAPEPPPPRTFRSKLVSVVPERPEDVGDDPKAIVAFLAARYRSIRLNRLDAAAGYFRELRREFGLAPRNYRFKRDDVRLAFYVDSESSTARILKAWQDFRRDAARAQRASTPN